MKSEKRSSCFLIQNKFEDRLKEVRRENLLSFISKYKYGRRLRKRNASNKNMKLFLETANKIVKIYKV